MQKQEYYNMYEAADYLWWYKSLREVLGFYMERYIKKSAVILDAGCGTGENMKYISSLGYNHLKGIDLSEDSILLSKKRGLKDIKQADITQLPFPDNTFDCIYNMDVLGALNKKDRQKVFQEFYRVLKPKGYLILQCAALESLRSQHDTVVNVSHRYTKAELEKEAKNFHILKLSYRFFLLFPLMAGIKWLKGHSKHEEATSDVNKPSVVVNTILLFIQRVENFFFPVINYPIGTSLFLVCQKN